MSKTLNDLELEARSMGITSLKFSWLGCWTATACGDGVAVVGQGEGVESAYDAAILKYRKNWGERMEKKHGQ